MVNTLQVFYESNFATVSYDDIGDYVLIVWHGIPSLDKAKAGLEEVLNALKLTRCTKLLSDNRGVSGSWTASNDWIANNWQPRAVQAGLQKVAFIISVNLLTKISIENLQTKLIKQRKMPQERAQVFDNWETAKQWVLEQ